MPGVASDERSTLVLHLRRGRRRAKTAASAEACALLRDLDPAPASGGPLSEVAGVIWVTVPAANARCAAERVRRLGYTEAVDLVVPASQTTDPAPVVRWRKQDVALVRVYEESDASLRDDAPDRRSFLLECGDGEVRRIVGYRGGRGPREHRALAVPDARLLANLVGPVGPGIMLDPFAGAGGIAIEAVRRGWRTVTVDVDRSLRFGLAEIASTHIVADAAALPIASQSIAAIATEPPYDLTSLGEVVASLGELERVLVPSGTIVFLASVHQADPLREAGESYHLSLVLDAAIDRKGSDVVCLGWKKVARSPLIRV